MLELISWFFMGMSLLGGFFITSLRSKYRLIGFILWVITAIFWITFNIINRHYSMSFMYIIYLIQSIIGIYKNKKLSID